MKKLSSGDPLTTHRELYMRNVSSKELHFNGSEEEPEQDQPPANRQQGDVITFDRYASYSFRTEIAALLQFPLQASPADTHSALCHIMLAHLVCKEQAWESLQQHRCKMYIHSCQRCCKGNTVGAHWILVNEV